MIGSSAEGKKKHSCVSSNEKLKEIGIGSVCTEELRLAF